MEMINRQICVEHNKISQTSKILTLIKNGLGDVTERLLAEKLLLESDIKLRVILESMENNVATTFSHVEGNICISKINCNIKLGRGKNEYFVLVVRCGTDVYLSKIVQMQNSNVLFDDEFKFNFNRKSELLIELYSIYLERRPISMRNTLSKKCKTLFRRSRVCYLKADESIKTAFKFCGQLLVTPEERFKSTFTFKTLVLDCSIEDGIAMKIAVHHHKNELKKSGFLTVGTHGISGVIIWNRQWVILVGSILKFYNSPTAEHFSEPNLKLDTIILSKPKLALRIHCPRSRTLHLSNANKHYFLRTDNSYDLQQWQTALESVHK